MTLRVLSHLLEDPFTKNLVFLCSFIFYQKVPLVKNEFKSPALVDLQSVSPISPKRYIYNYRESYHDKIIASVTLHVTVLHVTGFHESFCSFVF